MYLGDLSVRGPRNLYRLDFRTWNDGVTTLMVEKAFYKIGFIQVGVTFGGDVVSVDLHWRMKLIIGRIWGLVFAMDHHDSQVCNVCNTRCIILSFLHCFLFKRMMDSRLWNLQALCAPIVICESCSFFH